MVNSFMFEAGTKYLSAFCSYSVSPLSASALSSPHSPLFVGVVPSNASARAANFAVAFFEAALRFFEPQHTGSVFLFDGAARYCAPLPKAHTALATATAALRCRIFSILIFHSRLSRSPKSIVQWQRIPSPARLIYRTNPCLKPVGEASFLRPEVAPSLRAL